MSETTQTTQQQGVPRRFAENLCLLRRLAQERDYQDARWPDSRRLAVGEEILLASVYLGKAARAWQENTGDEAALREVRKATAILLRCMENHGCPPRTDARMRPDAGERRCPKCGSHDPRLHPAVQFEGEVQECGHPFHSIGEAAP